MNIDITKQTAPTIQILDDFLNKVGLPFKDMLSSYVQSNYPGFSKLLSWKFKERFEKINRVYFWVETHPSTPPLQAFQA